MEIGLLWFDDDPGRDLAEKIGRAARRYRQKFGAPANICYTHPSALDNDDEARMVGLVYVSSKPSVLKHHFWIGQKKIDKEVESNT